jgi:hypothetical protein
MTTEAKYLNYLDKEMTIMGILFTFCVAVVALVLDRTCGAGAGQTDDVLHALAKGAKLRLARLDILRSRSGLLLHREISAGLVLSANSAEFGNVVNNNMSTSDWYRDADSWATWIPYHSAFTAVGLGSTMYVIALLGASKSWRIPAWLIWTGTAVTIVVQAIRLEIFRRYKYDDDPIGRVFPRLKRG